MDFASDEAKSFEELLEEARDQIKKCPEPVYIQSIETMMFRKFGWSDQKLEEIAAKIKFPRKVFEIRNYKAIITHFFNFYFTGKISENSTLQSTVYSAITLLNVSDKKNEYYRLIFDEQEYKESDQIKPFFYWIGKTTCVTFEKSQIFADNNDFNSEIQSILQSWIEKPMWLNEDQIQLMRLTGFLALTLCRIAARNSILLMGAFKSKAYRKNLSDYVGWQMGKSFWSPSVECIRKCYELKDNLSPLYAIVVSRWIKTLKTHPEDELASNLLYESLLRGTEGFGIEVIKMLESVLEYTGRNFQELMQVICFIDPEITHFTDWQALIHFRKIFSNENNPQYSYQWARLINNTYLQECTLEENSFVSATFAAILEYKVGPISRQSVWLNLRPHLSRRGLNLGAMIHEFLMDTDPDCEDIQKRASGKEKRRKCAT